MVVVYAVDSAHHSHPGYERALMRLTFWLLGHEVVAIDIGPATDDEDAAEPDAPPTIGGETGTTWLDTGTTDRYMGFTGGWEDDGE